MLGVRSLRRGLVAFLVASLLVAFPLLAMASTMFGISGYETFPGIRIGGTTFGASFAGWTHAVTGTWVSPPGDGGHWGASVNYVGSPGLGSSVTVVGGRYAVKTGDGTSFFGRVLSGLVIWPPDLTTSIDCGDGVAKFTILISDGLSFTPSGTINGCLDDTHITTGVFPPKIWATVNKN